MPLRMYCVADWVNYHLYDYTDILTSLRTVQEWWRQWAAEGGSRHA